VTLAIVLKRPFFVADRPGRDGFSFLFLIFMLQNGSEKSKLKPGK
jgi:hypothetical protein